MRGHPRLPLQAEGARWSHSIGVLEPRVPQRPTMLSRRAERENQEPSCASVTDSGGASDAIAPDLKYRIKWTRFRHTQVWAWREKDYFLTSEHLVSLSGWVTPSAGMRRNATDASERRTAPWLLRPGTRRSRAIWAASCWGPCARPSPAPRFDKPHDSRARQSTWRLSSRRLNLAMSPCIRSRHHRAIRQPGRRHQP